MQDKKLHITVCSFLVPEVAHVLEGPAYYDVELHSFSSNCTNSCSQLRNLKNRLAHLKKYSNHVAIASNCIAPLLEEQEKIEGMELKHISQCFELFLNKEIIHHFISKGYYVITNGWLRSYKASIKEWGFDAKTAKQFFGESMKKIMFLDTFLPGDYLERLKEFSGYTGLEYEIFPVGIDHLRNYLDSIVSKWRSDASRKSTNDTLARITKENADFAVIYNILIKLVDIATEDDIVWEIINLLNVLFAPVSINYIKKDGDLQKHMKYDMRSDATFVKTEANSFSFSFVHQRELLGEIEIEGIRFPEFLNQYKRMGRLIGLLSGLALSNVRRYSELDTKKQQLEIYSKKLDESNKTKDKFFSIIAHDLRSPFSAFLGLTSFMLEEIDTMPKDELREMVTSINKTTTSLHQLLENLLAWASSNRGALPFNPRLIEIGEPFKNAQLAVEPIARNKGIVIHNQAFGQIEIYADSSMLETVLRNLLTNAIKFTPVNGDVIISTKELLGCMEICVSDTGIGMSKSVAERLFSGGINETRNGTNHEKGTGLGLMISKQFVEKHGGRIWVESEENRGSRFYFTIPLNRRSSCREQKNTRTR